MKCNGTQIRRQIIVFTLRSLFSAHVQQRRSVADLFAMQENKTPKWLPVWKPWLVKYKSHGVIENKHYIYPLFLKIDTLTRIKINIKR